MIRVADITWITENKCRIILGLQTDYFWITKKVSDYFWITKKGVGLFSDYKKRCRIIFGLFFDYKGLQKKSFGIIFGLQKKCSDYFWITKKGVGLFLDYNGLFLDYKKKRRIILHYRQWIGHICSSEEHLIRIRKKKTKGTKGKYR